MYTVACKWTDYRTEDIGISYKTNILCNPTELKTLHFLQYSTIRFSYNPKTYCSSSLFNKNNLFYTFFRIVIFYHVQYVSRQPYFSGSFFAAIFTPNPLNPAPGWRGGRGLMSRCRWCLCCGQRAARWQWGRQRTHQLQPSRPQTSTENITKICGVFKTINAPLVLIVREVIFLCGPNT
jgi:hypothetical protein